VPVLKVEQGVNDKFRLEGRGCRGLACSTLDAGESSKCSSAPHRVRPRWRV